MMNDDLFFCVCVCGSFLAVKEICFPDLFMLYLTGVCFLMLAKMDVLYFISSYISGTALP